MRWTFDVREGMTEAIGESWPLLVVGVIGTLMLVGGLLTLWSSE
jgi:hypothetical protein